MKKILTILVLMLLSMTSFGQIKTEHEYLGEKYDDFFQDMLIDQQNGENPNVLVIEPIKKTIGELYSMTVVWKNTSSNIIIISSYLFDKTNVCVQIVAFTVLPDRKFRKTVLNLMKQACDVQFIKIKDCWYQYTDKMTVKITIEEQEIDGVKGVTIIAEKI
jgi:hypothetical protein